jgi:hypothetical protein
VAQVFDLRTITDKRGNLTVIEREIPFAIKRIFYIYGVDDSVRGKHRHHQTRQFLIAIKGSCRIVNHPGPGQAFTEYLLDAPSKGLLIEPTDWHYMDQFSADCILQVFASTYFDAADYIYEDYSKDQ